ncbi:MAG: hypothetical protein ACFFB3_20075 [Candidatus Hodarchaeota archaeon]
MKNDNLTKKGTTRTIYFPNGLDLKVEEARIRLGWSRSYLIKYAITRLLQELSFLKSSLHSQTHEEVEIDHPP